MIQFQYNLYKSRGYSLSNDNKNAKGNVYGQRGQDMWNYNLYDAYDRKTGLALDSKVVHGALGGDPAAGAVNFPIYQTAAYRHGDLDGTVGADRLWGQNPTCQELERTMAILEGGSQGASFSSGQAAVLAVLGLLKDGEHAVVSESFRWGIFGSCEDICRKAGCQCSFVDMGNMEQVMGAIRPETKIILAATPSGPAMRVADIKRLSETAKRAGALLAVDNSYLTPYFQRPIMLGADLVIYSECKYLGGHNDANGGLVIGADKEPAGYYMSLLKKQAGTVAQIAPFDAWLLLRGLKTLALRMKKHQENAIEVAEWLKKHSKVQKLYYTGLREDPGYGIMCWQAAGFGGIITFEAESEACARNFLSKLKMVVFADGFGGTESMVSYPYMYADTESARETARKAGIHERLLRLSVGIEEVRDIVGDLGQAL